VATPAAPASAAARQAPGSLQQVTKLTRYQLREYVRGRRYVALLGIIVAIGAIITAVVAHFHGARSTSGQLFYGTYWGSGASFVVVLAAVFFGGDAIAGEFQNKTGYFLMGLPVRRATVYIGKFIAAFLATISVMLVFLGILVANGAYYFGSGALPWQLGVSLVIAIVYTGAVLAAAFLFSSLFKTSAYGFLLTAVLFLVGFTLLQALIADLANLQPYMIISYASSTIGTVFGSGVNWSLSGVKTVSTMMVGPRMVTTTTYTAGVAQGIVLMLAYFIESFAVGLWLFEREEFT
jgi:ABC-2 type transport system permease protein